MNSRFEQQILERSKTESNRRLLTAFFKNEPLHGMPFWHPKHGWGYALGNVGSQIKGSVNSYGLLWFRPSEIDAASKINAGEFDE